MENRSLIITSLTILMMGSALQAMDVDRSGNDLRNAAIRGDLDQMKKLLAGGALVDAKSGYGRTALHWASEGNKYAICKLLLDNGADVNAKNKSGTTALMLAVKGLNPRSINETCKLLIAHGADVNAQTNDGYTALLLAASFPFFQNGHEMEICKLLIRAIVGQNPEEQKSAATTTFDILKKKGHGKDMPIMITQELKAKQRLKYQGNKAQAHTQIMKTQASVSKQELLDYLNSL